MNDLERLIALEDIRSLKARYWRFMDSKDWDSLLTVFSDDSTMDMSQAGNIGGGSTRGPQAVVDFIRMHVNDAVTVHQGHTSEIEFQSDTEATGIWPMMDVLQWPAGSPASGIKGITGWGHYRDRYVRTSDGWRISFTSVTRLRVDEIPADS